MLFRRSADVRSVGYSELLCLSQKDLMEVRFWRYFCKRKSFIVTKYNLLLETQFAQQWKNVLYKSTMILRRLLLDPFKAITKEQCNLHFTQLPATLLIGLVNKKV